jgi:hypothetical protein
MQKQNPIRTLSGWGFVFALEQKSEVSKQAASGQCPDAQ